jgi:oxalate decarboxylase/phosphoglucose isomerase-like protein (cupin superfamily)|tara:strand:+ start:1795 stop:2202 length:408 start_codon:yes stop_codon:yes gene_type:complete
MKTLNDVKTFTFREFLEEDGNLIPIESGTDIPFDIKRVFYVHGVHDQNDRGKHAHYETKQILICLQGEVDVTVDDGHMKKVITLNKKNQAVLVPEMIWDEQIYKTDDTILLVLCNTRYDVDDYINDYNEFKKLKK